MLSLERFARIVFIGEISRYLAVENYRDTVVVRDLFPNM